MSNNLDFDDAQRLVAEQCGADFVVFGWLHFFVETGAETVSSKYCGLLPWHHVTELCSDLLKTYFDDVRGSSAVEMLRVGKCPIYYLYTRSVFERTTFGGGGVLLERSELQNLFQEPETTMVDLDPPFSLSDF